MKYYTPTKILSYNAKYNMIIGERSNGKTFSIWEYGLKRYCETKTQMAIIRRWQDDFKGKRGAEMASGIVNEGLVKKYSKGQWDRIIYRSGMWYLAKLDENEAVIKDVTPFAYGFALSAMEHDKSTSYPNITTVLFDEFLTRDYYLPNEFVIFMNVLSTIIRDRNNVTIFMLGNTVNKYSPYFDEMGIKHIKDMKKGSIDLYEYGDSGLKVAVEYCQPNKQGKKSDVYFAFDNPKLNMITGGEWELDIYPHCPTKYTNKDVHFKYFILFGEETLQCDIIYTDYGYYTYIHKKTGEIKYPDEDIVFTAEPIYKRNYRRKITNPYDEIGKKIYKFFQTDKVFYQSNDIGELVRNYLIWCRHSST